MATMAEEEAAMVEAMRAAGHEPRVDKSGGIDWFYLDFEDCGTLHNGPGCATCGESWCQHCWARGRQAIEPCKGQPIDAASGFGPGLNVAADKERELQRNRDAIRRMWP